MHSAQHAGGEAEDPAHPVRHVALMGKPRRQSDFCERHVGRQDEQFGALDPARQYIVMSRHAESGAKEWLQMRYAETDRRGEIAKGQRLIYMRFDEILRCL